VDGASAYEIAVSNGTFAGTEAEFAESLVGGCRTGFYETALECGPGA
jgi:hypothetical protein